MKWKLFLVLGPLVFMAALSSIASVNIVGGGICAGNRACMVRDPIGKNDLEKVLWVNPSCFGYGCKN